LIQSQGGGNHHCREEQYAGPLRTAQQQNKYGAHRNDLDDPANQRDDRFALEVNLAPTRYQRDHERQQRGSRCLSAAQR